MTGGDGLAGPVVSGSAGLEQDGCGFVLSEERGELGPRQAVARYDKVEVIGDGDFEDSLCEVDRDDLRLHGGLFLLGDIR